MKFENGQLALHITNDTIRAGRVLVDATTDYPYGFDTSIDPVELEGDHWFDPEGVSILGEESGIIRPVNLVSLPMRHDAGHFAKMRIIIVHMDPSDGELTAAIAGSFSRDQLVEAAHFSVQLSMANARPEKYAILDVMYDDKEASWSVIDTRTNLEQGDFG